MKRVVITGTGIVSALGCTPAEAYERIRAGESAVVLQENWDGVPSAPLHLEPEQIKSIPRALRRSMGNLAVYTGLAARSAAEQAQADASVLQESHAACVIGSTMGSPGAMDETYRILYTEGSADNISPMQFFKSASHTAAFNTANLLNLQDCVYAPSSACASGLQAVGLAFDLIRAGQCSMAVCGGGDELSRMVSGSFELISAIAENTTGNPADAPRPFDRDRTGLVCGEGAGILILEELEHARTRKIPILAEVLSYASTSSHTAGISQSDRRGIARCIRLCLDNAGLTPGDISCISAHATSTVQGDAAEALALKEVFGNIRVPIFSLKGHLGHTLGASGSLELALCMEMMKRGEILPTRNFRNPADECAGLDIVSEVRPVKPGIILKNCFAFGGINAALICRAYSEES